MGFRGVGHFYRFTPIPGRRQLLPFYSNSRLATFTVLPSDPFFCFGALRAPSTHAPRCAVHRPPIACVTELKEELAARDEAVSGNKAWLRRRLHAAIVREYVDGAMEDEGE